MVPGLSPNMFEKTKSYLKIKTLTQCLSQICDKSLDNATKTFIACSLLASPPSSADIETGRNGREFGQINGKIHSLPVPISAVMLGGFQHFPC